MPRRLTPSEKNLIAQNQQSAPVDLLQIAKGLNIEIFNSDLAPSMAGELRRKNDRQWVIRVNRNDQPVRKRFTIAHEIAHFLLHRDQVESECGIEDNVFYRSALSNKMETEANQLAADILMPWRLINSLNENKTPPQDLARKLEVSITAMNIRLGLPTKTKKPLKRAAFLFLTFPLQRQPLNKCRS